MKREEIFEALEPLVKTFKELGVSDLLKKAMLEGRV